jgi:hypothetical protein
LRQPPEVGHIADRRGLTMPQAAQQESSEIVARYAAVWNEPDVEVRLNAVRALWNSDGAEFVEGLAFRGHDELSARIGRAYEQFVASGQYTATTAGDVSIHGDIVTFTIQLATPDDEVAWAARVFLILEADGRIHEDYHLTIKPLVA